MAAKKRPTSPVKSREVPTAETRDKDNTGVVSPLRKSGWQLIGASMLWAIWLIFLAWMAFTG